MRSYATLLTTLIIMIYLSVILSTDCKEQNAGVREPDDEGMFPFLDLDFDLAVDVRHGALVVAGEHDEDEKERRQKFDAERLALGHVTPGYRASGRCPRHDVICATVFDNTCAAIQKSCCSID